MATYTNLDNEIFAQSALQAFTKTLLPLSAFSTNFSPDPVQKGNNVLVPLIAALTATTFGGSYVSTAGSKTVITVAINRHKVVLIGQSDLDAAGSSEASLESFGWQQGRALAQAVLEDIFTLVTTANFSIVSTVASTALNVPELRKARLALNQANCPPEPRSAIIDCVPYDALLSVTNFVQAHMFNDSQVLSEGRLMRALGFNFYEVNSVFVSGASINGFFCHPQAVAVAMRYLQPQPGNTYLNARPVSDPQTGFTMGLRDFFDNATGYRYIALEANYGYSAGITNAGRIVGRTD
jgi:hypothetical protein